MGLITKDKVLGCGGVAKMQHHCRCCFIAIHHDKTLTKNGKAPVFASKLASNQQTTTTDNHRVYSTSWWSFWPMGLITGSKVLGRGGVAKMQHHCCCCCYRDTIAISISIIDYRFDAKSFSSEKVLLCTFSGTCAYVCDFFIKNSKRTL